MMFLTEFHGSDAARLTAAADTVFAALVDIDRLPSGTPASTASSKAPRPPAR